MPLVFDLPGSFGQSYNLFSPILDVGSQYTPVSTDLLAASQLALQNEIQTGFASVAFNSDYQFSTLADLFGHWADQSNGISQSIAQGYNEAINKSAKACGGFFSCIFG